MGAAWGRVRPGVIVPISLRSLGSMISDPSVLPAIVSFRPRKAFFCEIAVIVLATAGDHAMVAASSVVTKLVFAYSVVAGVLAQVVATRGLRSGLGAD